MRKIKTILSKDQVFIDVIQLKKSFSSFVKDDMKDFRGRNTAIYYELLSRENCKLTGREYGESFTALDDSPAYLDQKAKRESDGYKYGKPTPVTIGGVHMKRIIITSPNNGNVADFFGFASNYLQAGNEQVCYMKYVK